MKNQGFYVELGKKEYHKQYKQSTYKCFCRCIVKKSNKACHERTYKHNKRMPYDDPDDDY